VHKSDEAERVQSVSYPHKIIVGQGRNSSSFRGVIFMNFHSMTSSNYVIDAYSTVVQLFRKRSQICSFRYISENENLLVLIRPVT